MPPQKSWRDSYDLGTVRENRAHILRIDSAKVFGAGFAAFIRKGGLIMPRGDKGSYTDKQKRQAEHIEESYEKEGVSKKEAESRAWATVNKESGGGKKSGSGRGKS